MDDQKEAFLTYLLNGKPPRLFQLKPLDILYNGNPVILSAPTGSGKTWAAIFPFLYAKKEGLLFADRLFYVLPLRTLARSIYKDVKNKVEEFNSDYGFEYKVTIQMGDQPEDPLFNGDIIITTIDQLLSNYIGASLSTSRGQANIPPGSFIGSYIVFDEIHAVPDKSLPTILDMVRRLRSFARFLLMTATIPSTVIEEMNSRIDGISIIASENDLETIEKTNNDIKSLQYRRVLNWIEAEIDEHKILDLHLQQDGIRKTIVVINRVEKAQQIYIKVKKLLRENKLTDSIYLLHSRFLSNDRIKIEEEVINALGKTVQDNKNIIVISTQVLEVGLDISSKVLISELAPANALIQRAGRCARYFGENGSVYIFDLPLKANGKIDTSPYVEKDNYQLVVNTRDFLSQNNVIQMTLQNEISMVEEIHQRIDLNRLQAISCSRVKQLVEQSLILGEYNNLKKLVRDIPNISLIIHNKPEDLDMTLIPERFSIRTETLIYYLSNFDDYKNKVWGYSWNNEDEGEWKLIEKPQDLYNYTITAFHSELVLYDEKLGLFLLGNDGCGELTEFIDSNYSARYTLDKPKELNQQYRYRKEKYVEHVLGVRNLFTKQKELTEVGYKYLSDYFQVSEKDLEQIIEMAVTFHDVGKLNSNIVLKFWDWQKNRKNEVINEFLAHTDYDPENKKDFYEWKRQRKTPHAVESAIITLPLVKVRVEKFIIDKQSANLFVKTIFTAIARHHGSYTSNLINGGDIYKGATSTIIGTINKLGFNGLPIRVESKWENSMNINRLLIKPTEVEFWLLYWFIVRNIRITDQESMELKMEEVNK